MRPLTEVGVGDIQAALAEYSRRWLPNALAVAELTEGGFGNNARAFAPNLKLAQVSRALAGGLSGPARRGSTRGAQLVPGLHNIDAHTHTCLSHLLWLVP